MTSVIAENTHGIAVQCSEKILKMASNGENITSLEDFSKYEVDDFKNYSCETGIQASDAGKGKRKDFLKSFKLSMALST